MTPSALGAKAQYKKGCKMAKENAAVAFQDAKRDVHALLDLICLEVNEQLQKAEQAGPNWPWVGSVRHWREQLIQMLITMMNADDEAACREMIENTLADVKALAGKG